jgi:predicted nucleotide-binding protein
MSLADFIKQVPEFGMLSGSPSKLVPHFALFIELQDSQAVITPGDINALFDESRVRRPANTSDVMRKSSAFVRVKGGGYRLGHSAREILLSSLHEQQVDRGNHVSPAGRLVSPPDGVAAQAGSKHDVFVVYGRDHRLRRDLFSFLRSVGVNPLEFEEMSHLTGSTSPSTWEVIQAGFARAQACVVLFSPDELVTLREELRESDDSDVPQYQSRANVLVEAGMALALHPKRTIIVKVGHVREVSDLDGIQYVNLTGSAESRNKLVGKLQLAGCEIKTHGEDWLNVGNFNIEAIRSA